MYVKVFTGLLIEVVIIIYVRVIVLFADTYALFQTSLIIISLGGVLKRKLLMEENFVSYLRWRICFFFLLFISCLLVYIQCEMRHCCTCVKMNHCREK